MNLHDLKIYPEYFAPVREGKKTFEIRRNGTFEVGDIVFLREYDPVQNRYTGEFEARRITYITNYAQKDDYVVFGIEH